MDDPGQDLGSLRKVPSVVQEVMVPICTKHNLHLRRSDHSRNGQIYYYCNELACLKLVIDFRERTFFVTVLNIAGKGEWWENGPCLSLDHGLATFAPGVRADYSGVDPRDAEQIRQELVAKLELIERYFPQTLDGDFSAVPEDALT